MHFSLDYSDFGLKLLDFLGFLNDFSAQIPDDLVLEVVRSLKHFIHLSHFGLPPKW